MFWFWLFLMAYLEFGVIFWIYLWAHGTTPPWYFVFDWAFDGLLIDVCGLTKRVIKHVIWMYKNE